MSKKARQGSLEEIIKSAEKKLVQLERQRDHIALSIHEKRDEIEKLDQAAKALRELEKNLKKLD
ncbi:MAG: hypothetical protein H0U74_23395 [Bradymonadaceae bacterium]|nr:hypothetical protein [Lujinxingiaceae bacterium]